MSERCPKCGGTKTRAIRELFDPRRAKWFCDGCQEMWPVESSRFYSNDPQPTPPAEPVPDTVEQAKKLHIAFNVALRRAGVGHLPACDGPDCLICRDPAVLKALAAGAQGEREALAPVLAEMEKAARKFPTWPTRGTDAATIVAEECGELQQAVLQATYEGGDPEAVRKEAIQTAAMALQFLLNLPDTRFERCEQTAKRTLSATPPDAPAGRE